MPATPPAPAPPYAEPAPASTLLGRYKVCVEIVAIIVGLVVAFGGGWYERRTTITAANINASAARHGPNTTVQGARITAQATREAAGATIQNSELSVLTSKDSVCVTHPQRPVCRQAAADYRRRLAAARAGRTP